MVYRIHRRCGQTVGRLRVVFCCNIRDEPEESGLREWREQKKKSLSVAYLVFFIRIL